MDRCRITLIALVLASLAMAQESVPALRDAADQGQQLFDGARRPVPAVQGRPEVRSQVERMPEFPGGQQELMRYLSGRVRYPEQARADGVEGTVYVTFVVDVEGRVTEVKTLRGIGGGCDEAAVAAVQDMPRWLPGQHDGKAVPVRLTLPVRFALTDGNPR